MANDEHVAILKKGVDAWNEWRERNTDVRPDLRAVNLSGQTSAARAWAGRTSAARAFRPPV
jgi:hypothetical protein